MIIYISSLSLSLSLSLHLCCVQRTLGWSWTYPFRTTLSCLPSLLSLSPLTTLILQLQLMLMCCDQSTTVVVMEITTLLVTSPLFVRQTILRGTCISSIVLVMVIVNRTLVLITSLISTRVLGFTTTPWMLLQLNETPVHFMLHTVDRSVYWVSSGHFIWAVLGYHGLFICAVPVSDISMKVNEDNKFEVNVEGKVKISALGSWVLTNTSNISFLIYRLFVLFLSLSPISYIHTTVGVLSQRVGISQHQGR